MKKNKNKKKIIQQPEAKLPWFYAVAKEHAERDYNNRARFRCPCGYCESARRSGCKFNFFEAVA